MRNLLKKLDDDNEKEEVSDIKEESECQNESNEDTNRIIEEKPLDSENDNHNEQNMKRDISEKNTVEDFGADKEVKKVNIDNHDSNESN